MVKTFTNALEHNFENCNKVLVKNIGSGKPQTVYDFAQYWWKYWNATGELKFGAIPYRDNEIMRIVPEI